MKKIKKSDKYRNYDAVYFDSTNVKKGTKQAKYMLNLIQLVIGKFPLQKTHLDGDKKTREYQKFLLNNLKKGVIRLYEELENVMNIVKDDKETNCDELKNYLIHNSDLPQYKSIPEVLKPKVMSSPQKVDEADKMFWANETHFAQGYSVLSGWEAQLNYLELMKTHIQNVHDKVTKPPTKNSYYILIVEIVAIFNKFQQWNKIPKKELRAKLEQFVKTVLWQLFERELLKENDTNISSRMLNKAIKEAERVEVGEEDTISASFPHKFKIKK